MNQYTLSVITPGGGYTTWFQNSYLAIQERHFIAGKHLLDVYSDEYGCKLTGTKITFPSEEEATMFLLRWS